TRSDRDWSSDVCSSDLTQCCEGSRLSLSLLGGSSAGCRRGPQYRLDPPDNRTGGEGRDPGSGCVSTSQGAGDWREPGNSTEAPRSEERRVGKEGRYRGG